MTDLPKRKRGRPSKADLAAREAQKQQAAEARKKTPDGQTDSFLDDKLSQTIGRRKHLLEPDEDTLRTIFELSKLLCSQKEIAAVLGVSERTLSTFLNAHPEARDAWEDGQSFGKISLRRKQLQLADKNAPAAIFLGKNILHQKDVIHTNANVTHTATELTEEQLLEIIERGKVKPVAKQDGSKSVH